MWASLPLRAPTGLLDHPSSHPDRLDNVGYRLFGYCRCYMYDNTGNFVSDLSGPGYSGGSGQWNFFGTMPQGPNGEYVITSNAWRTTLLGTSSLQHLAQQSGSAKPATADIPDTA